MNTENLDSNPDKSIDLETDDFYYKAQKYWSQIPATVNGMLGGLGFISDIDIRGSKEFLKSLHQLGSNYALDCGAGIGRVSKNLLMPMFKKVDLVEQDQSFAKTATNYCGIHCDRQGIIFNVGLQEFTPEPGKYDLVWSQWVLGHLTDNDLLLFFKRIKKGLTPSGYFVLKENTTSSHKIEKDEVDSSVTRSLKSYEDILKCAGFCILKMCTQKNFPKELYPVITIACKPINYDT